MPQHAASILAHAAQMYPQRVALIDLGASDEARRQWTYAQWAAASGRWSHWLQSADVAEGDRVAVCCANGLELAALWFGVVAAGCVVVPIPVTSSRTEIEARMQHAGCRVLVADASRFELARAAIANVARRPILVLDTDVALEPTIDTHASQPAQTAERSLDVLGPGDEATAMILYTSGTTAQSKGACISHRALVTHTRVLSEQVLRLDMHDRVLGVLPLSHSYGCRMLLLAVAHVGATAVLTSRFDAARSLRIMDNESITWVPAVPTMFAAWSQAVEHTPALRPVAGTLKWAMSAGAPIADALVQRAEAALGAQVRQAYGMTEATLSTVNGPEDARVIGCVGRAAPGVSLRIVDPRGDDVARGQRGEVWVRGHNTMSGYLDAPELTDAEMTDGWFRSGDVGYLDADDNLWIVDRIKDLIIVGGVNVVPAEVEGVIAEHDAVAQVAVVGRVHAYYGEEVAAFVVPKLNATIDADALLRWCAERLSKVKTPRALFVIDAFPIGPSGKVLKRVLREQLMAQASVHDAADATKGTCGST